MLLVDKLKLTAFIVISCTSSSIANNSLILPVKPQEPRGTLRSKVECRFNACKCVQHMQHSTHMQQQIGRRNITVNESPDYEVVEGQHGEQENDSDVYENITQL